MTSRRAFITGMLAAGVVPRPTLADVGHPAFLSAGMKPDGSHVLCGLRADGERLFECPLPARGHAAAAHPIRPEALAFARRPGTYAIVLDCLNGGQLARLQAPEGHHFYGHGVFSADGGMLFTTENDFENAQGMVGIWDARHGYKRLGAFASGGIGPHDIKLLPDGARLVVANGGIETHPDTGRSKLNLPTMRSNLSYFALDGRPLSQLTLDPAHQRNSIRHLAVSKGGSVAFAMQWQGDLASDLPLLGVHVPDKDWHVLFEDCTIRKMQGYLGSVAVSSNGERIATTSPRNGLVQVFGPDRSATEMRLPDVCGVAAAADGFVVTTGTGLIRAHGAEDVRHDIAWDNHLITI